MQRVSPLIATLKNDVVINPNEIEAIMITLTVADNQVLFILLSSDGTINRMGDGSPECKDHDLFIGQTGTQPMISQIRSMITPDMQEFLHKTFDLPEKKGRHCSLKMLFKTYSLETGVEFLYGEHSQGPPHEFAEMVRKAAHLTEHWHLAQKKGKQQATTTPAKPWWKFWQRCYYPANSHMCKS